MEDDEAAVVGFAGGFELGDDAPLEGRGADVDGGKPVFEIVVWAVFSALNTNSGKRLSMVLV